MLASSNLECYDWKILVAVAFCHLSEGLFRTPSVVPDAVRITHLIHLAVASAGSMKSQTIANHYQLAYAFAMIDLSRPNTSAFGNICYIVLAKADFFRLLLVFPMSLSGTSVDYSSRRQERASSFIENSERRDTEVTLQSDWVEGPL
jgi:hypothetical protein